MLFQTNCVLLMRVVCRTISHLFDNSHQCRAGSGECMPGQLTVVMAQLNLLVGDIKGNTDRVIAAARQAIDGLFARSF